MNFKVQPRKHQHDLYLKAAPLPGWGLFWGVGSGKTYGCLLLVRDKFNKAGRVLRTIIFTPPRVVPGWRDQWYEKTGIDQKKVVLLIGSQKDRLELFRKHAYDAQLASQGCVFVTNYESLLMDGLFEQFQAWAPEVLVFDESHKLKSISAKRSKRADLLANPYNKKEKRRLPRPYTYCLSGSPLLKNLMDAFMQFKVLDGGDTFGWNFMEFRNRYFYDKNAGMPKDKYFPDWQLRTTQTGFDSLGVMQRLMARTSNYLPTNECVDLPLEQDEIVMCEMGASQKRLYNEMKRDLLTFYNNRAATASLAITKALRLMQITSGFVATEEPGRGDTLPVALDKNPKLEMFKELLEELIEKDQSVLVWAVFKENYNMLRTAIQEVLGKTFSMVECHGGISSTKQDEALVKFRDDPLCRVFMGHPKSGGIGTNSLMKAGVDITYSRDFSLEGYIQSRGRNVRDGSLAMGHKSIMHYQLVMRDTVDELALKKLVAKEDMSDAVFASIIDELGKQ